MHDAKRKAIRVVQLHFDIIELGPHKDRTQPVKAFHPLQPGFHLPECLPHC